MPLASIVITTRNRKEMAARAVKSALEQEGDNQVIVIDDGSIDGTADFLRQMYPDIVLHRFEKSEGLIVQRSRGAKLAAGAFLFSIDDDAEFSDRQIVSKIAAQFDDPLIGAVAIPHINCRPDGTEESRMLPVPPGDGRTYLTSSYIGTAYALRRELFLQLGGYQNFFYQWGEEGEYCMRLLNAGYAVRLGDSPVIRHYPGFAGHYNRKVNRYIGRNRLLTVWLNAPARYLVPLLGQRTLQSLRGIFSSAPLTAFEGLLMGYAAMARGFNLRRPMSLDRFQLYVEIHRRRVVPLEEVRPRLMARD